MTTNQLTPIQQVAHDAAYTQADGRRFAENRCLRDFDADLRWARASFPVSDSKFAGARARHWAIACARVVARLHRVGVR